MGVVGKRLAIVLFDYSLLLAIYNLEHYRNSRDHYENERIFHINIDHNNSRVQYCFPSK